MRELQKQKPVEPFPLRNILFVDRPSKFLFLFLNSDTVLSDSVQKFSPSFNKLNEIE